MTAAFPPAVDKRKKKLSLLTHPDRFDWVKYLKYGKAKHDLGANQHKVKQQSADLPIGDSWNIKQVKPLQIPSIANMLFMVIRTTDQN